MIRLIFVFHTSTGELFWDRVNDITFVRFFRGKWYVERDTGEFQVCKSELVADLDYERLQLMTRTAEGVNAIFASMICMCIPAIPRDLLAMTESYLSAIYSWPVRMPRSPNGYNALDLAKMRLRRQCGGVKYYCGIRTPNKYVIAKCVPYGDGKRSWRLHNGSNWAPVGLIRYGLLEEKFAIAEN